MPRSSTKRTIQPEAIFDSLMASSNYERMTGYTPFFHAWFADLPRLCCGMSCTFLVLLCAKESLGRPRDKGQPMAEWTLDLDKGWLATVCRTDRRSVDRDLRYLEKSGMAQIRHTIRGTVAVRLLFRDWSKLPDYSPEEREKAPAETDPRETVELVKTPRRVNAGDYSEPIRISCPISSFRFQAGGSVDLAFTAVVKGGEFLLVTEGLLENSTSQCFQQKGTKTERTCRDEAKSERKAKGEVKAKHPRAEELARLFDPLLLRSCQRSLSTDPVVFTEALNAVGDVPHDFLVKFVIQRAERPISSPKVCASIVKDCAANWRKVKDLPDAQRIPPQSAKKNSGFFENVQRVIGERIARGEKPL